MNMSKSIFIILFAAVVLYAFVQGLLLHQGIEQGFSISKIESQKKITRLCLDYNSRLFKRSREKSEKTDLRNQLKKIQEHYSYLLLLGKFKGKVISRMLFWMLIFSLSFFLVLALLQFFSLKIFLRPLEVILQNLQNYARNKKISLIQDYKTFFKNKKELSIITTYQTVLLELKKFQDEERIRNQIAAWRNIARMMVHELKNVFSPLQLAVDSLLYYQKSDLALVKDLEQIKGHLSRIEQIIGAFRGFSALPEVQFKKIYCLSLVREIIYEQRWQEDIFCISENQNPESGYFLYTDPLYLRLILLNLLKNAYQAVLGQPEAIFISFEISPFQLRIADKGPGIKNEYLSKIFKPGFTTKTGGEGTGLFLVKELCSCLNIEIKVESQEGKGTEFHLIWRDDES